MVGSIAFVLYLFLFYFFFPSSKAQGVNVVLGFGSPGCMDKTEISSFLFLTQICFHQVHFTWSYGKVCLDTQ